MNKIKKIIIGTNNEGKYREISDLLPINIQKISPKEFNIVAPEETANSFQENSYIKALYYSKKTDLACLSDDSGLEIELLDGKPGIFSSRWNDGDKNFNKGIKRIYSEMEKVRKDWKAFNSAKFICCMTLYIPNGTHHSATGEIKGKISLEKKGNNGFGYDPIFIPNGYSYTFGEMKPKLKMSIDHRFEAFKKIKHFFS